jgi:HTH-type transcriptional regulator / antitoxin HigA
MIAKLNKSRPRRGAGGDAYLALVRQFPLRPLRNDFEHAAAMEIVRGLAAAEEGSLKDGEQDYLDALVVLLEDFDRRQEPWHRISGLQLLKHLMGETKMTLAELGKIVGSRPLASLILSGKREFSKEVIKRLGSHFHVDPGAFL